MDTSEWQSLDWSQHWLDTEETDSCWHLLEQSCSPSIVRVFDADAHPDVGHPIEARRQLGQTLSAFREQLVMVLRAVAHDRKDGADEVERYIVLKKVRHAVDEDQPSSTPAAWKVD